MATREQIHEILNGVSLTMKYRQTESGWWIAYCEQVPEARTQGKTKEEAKENLQDAVALILEDCSVDQLYEFRETVTLEQTDLIAL